MSKEYPNFFAVFWYISYIRVPDLQITPTFFVSGKFKRIDFSVSSMMLTNGSPTSRSISSIAQCAVLHGIQHNVAPHFFRHLPTSMNLGTNDSLLIFEANAILLGASVA